MSLIGAGLGGLLAGSLRGRAPVSLARLGLAAWLSVVLASLSCSMLLDISGTVPFAVSAPSMLAIHALIGGAEALITVFAYALLVQPVRVRRSSWVPGLAALVIALVLAPLASSSPDGLEWVAGKLGFLHASAPAFVAPLSGYALPLPLPNALSTGLAGVIGVLAVFAMGTLVAAGWNSLRPARIS
jgi:cobalt/nickel transport system permease protein